MLPGESTPKKGLTCRECGAGNPPDAPECWSCLRVDWSGDADGRPAPAFTAGGLRIIWLMFLILMIAVVCAIAVQAPLLGILLGVGLLGAWVITEYEGYRRHRSGRSFSLTQKIRWLISLTFVMPIVLLLAIVAAVGIVCTVLPYVYP